VGEAEKRLILLDCELSRCDFKGGMLTRRRWDSALSLVVVNSAAMLEKEVDVRLRR
jgi:hypothetical protein